VPDFDTLVAGSLAVNRLLGDGEVFDLGCGLKLNVLYTPGHSQGSLSILLLGYNVLFSGDAVPVPGELPIYGHVLASVASIKKLKAVKDIRFLLPSWDEPRQGATAYERMDAGLEYLQHVHDAVRRCSQISSDPDPTASPCTSLPPCRCFLALLSLTHLERSDHVVRILEVSSRGVGIESDEQMEPGLVWFHNNVGDHRGGILL
jgi:glyoxylase-like metal-dependent hydrolase (beta-lactamase superfamily II)